MRFPVTSRGQNALFRHVAAPGRCGATPPARLRGTMENGSTGQMRSSNPPPACGAGCARVRRSRFGVWPHGKVHSARPVGFRMRLSVECAFPHLGKRRATSRKSALCSRRNHNSVHKCPKTAPRGRFRRSVYTLCPHGRSCDRVGPRVPQHRRPHGPRDTKALGPEAHAAEAAAHLRCQALLSPLVALECHRHGMRRMPEQGQLGWSSRLARFNAWSL